VKLFRSSSPKRSCAADELFEIKKAKNKITNTVLKTLSTFMTLPPFFEHKYNSKKFLCKIKNSKGRIKCEILLLS
jgi:hypothetical protein